MSQTPTPLTKICVQMLTGSVGADLKLEAELCFRIEKNDSLPKGNWFSKDRLVGSSPWDLDRMQKVTFKIFSIDGNRKSRRFYPSQNNNGCGVTAGFMLTTDAVGRCSWEKFPVPSRSEYARYMWAVKDGRYGIWATQSHDADEFRLVGEDGKLHYVAV